MNQFASLAKEVFLPSTCCGCGTLSAGALCAACLEALKPPKGTRCIRCGHPGPKQGKLCGCAVCRQPGLHFFRLRSIGPYQGVVRKAVQAYRTHGIRELACLFAPILAGLFEREYHQEIIHGIEAVPSPPWPPSRPGLQGLDPNREIASRLAILLDLPIGDNMITMRGNLQGYGPMDPARQDGIRDGFKVKDLLKAAGKNILLVADVAGQRFGTMEAAWTLKRSGADKIFLLTLASQL